MIGLTGRRFSMAIALAVTATALPAAGQTAGAERRPAVGAPVPPPPVPPAVVSRNAEGGVSVRAVRIAQPINMDGRLDERLYSTSPAISDFIQQDPHEGEPASEKTEVWIFFDDKNIYISGRCWDSHPEREVSNEMRRDGPNITQNENFAVIFDTFHDRRNGLLFQVTPLGGLMDIAITDERDRNADWNTIWEARTSKFENGWTVEMVIPFKSLRYKREENQVWGINVRRIVRWKNEVSFLTRMPAFMLQRAIFSVSLGGTMVGLEIPAASRTLELKPYGISGIRTDHNADPAISNKVTRDVGFDVKYGVTKGLTADFTYNTDFAQVEDDQQQVNLTRFSLFFPEKRDFFLEGQGTFAFGGSVVVAGGGGAGGAVGIAPTNNTPVMFFSRRIGLNDGRPVPVQGGGRLTGRVGSYSLGLLGIRTDGDVVSGAQATTFSVLRMKRDLAKRGNIGAIYTGRSIATSGNGASETFGLDSLVSFSPSLNINAYYARTRTPGVTTDDTSYMGRIDYQSDRHGFQFEHLLVGDNFNPEVGFLRRKDLRRNSALLRFSPRPNATRMKAVRRFVYQGSFDYLRNVAGRLDTREAQGEFAIELQNSDRFAVQYSRNFEFIPEPFEISPNVTVPVGGYNYESVLTSYLLGGLHSVSGSLSYERGSLYNGTKQTLSYARGRVEFSPQLAVEPSVSVNWVDLPSGTFRATVASTRAIFTVTPRMYVTAFTQYNSGANSLSNNLRMRWEYLPGSELFVVYSDGRDTLKEGFPDLVNRTFVVKINRLLRF